MKAGAPAAALAVAVFTVLGAVLLAAPCSVAACQFGRVGGAQGRWRW